MKRTALVLVAVLLAACEHEVTAYPQQPPLVTKGANHREVLVMFRDQPDVETLNLMCASKPEKLDYGCAEYYAPSNPEYPDRALLIVYTLPPADFNDVPKLALLGHEVLHGRGWRHK